MMLARRKSLMVRWCKVMAHYTHGYHSAWVVLRMLEFIAIVITVIITIWSKEKQFCAAGMKDTVKWSEGLQLEVEFASK